MSYSLLKETSQLRWWTEKELDFRESAVKVFNSTIQSTLKNMNKAWVFHRTEGPMLVPRHMVSEEYTDNDIWTLKADIANGDAVMRPETTSSSYMAAKHILEGLDMKKNLPVCVWQVGKSYRRESSDGANAAKLRFFEFTQAEWQCIYGLNTMADYRIPIMENLSDKISWLTDRETRVIKSDRLPNYSSRTDDIEVLFNDRWTEVASISTRNDFEGAQVLEIAIGIDRIVDVASERAK